MDYLSEWAAQDLPELPNRAGRLMLHTDLTGDRRTLLAIGRDLRAQGDAPPELIPPWPMCDDLPSCPGDAYPPDLVAWLHAWQAVDPLATPWQD